MFEISVKTRFSAAHYLRGYSGSCSAVHGHNWDVQAFISGERLDQIGLLTDFRAVRKALEQVIEELDHGHLNELPGFADLNPTSENLAYYIYNKLGQSINDGRVRVSKVCVFETPDTMACYYESSDNAGREPCDD